MTRYAYERFSAQDASFLVFETPNTHMHLGGVMILDAGPLATPEGGVDIARIRRYVGSRLNMIPRYRQRVVRTPLDGHPVWIDDRHFNLSYHVRHTSLPRPGNDRQLKRLAGRIMSQQLDRSRPLWELWVVEGLEDNRFALITKAHHCMVDGIASVDLLLALMKPFPDESIETQDPWVPRPAPRRVDLLREEVLRRTQTPLTVAASLQRALVDPASTMRTVNEYAQAAWSLVGAGLKAPAATPLNRRIGPHRRNDWAVFDLGRVKQIKTRLGGTINDVVVAVVSGAVREFLEKRRVDIRNLEYKVVLPVNARSEEVDGLGNHVSAWLTTLPIRERDPRRRYARVRRLTVNLKESKQALGAAVLSQLGEWAGPIPLMLGVRLTALLHPYNLIVTNVPGPQMPLYLLGARMVEGAPVVPLFENQGLGVALFSYDGKLCWGYNADRDLMPDLHQFVEATERSFEELYESAVRPIEVSGGEAAARDRRMAG